MLDEIIVILWLACLPAILWAIPKTRRMTGSWITALKTVPPGCLTMLLLPALMSGALYWMNRNFKLLSRSALHWLELGIIVISFGVGILLIIKLARWSWRRWHAEGKRSILPFDVIFLFFTLSTVYISWAVPIVQYSINMGEFHGDWHPYRLPDENGVKITFEQRPIHPLLAEYDYRLAFRRNGTTVFRNLRTNTGGRTHFNLYRLKDGRLLFSDKDGDYIVDPSLPEVWYLHETDGRKYAVPFPHEKLRSWSWEMEGDTMMFRYNHGCAMPAIPLTDELEGKSYYGCITNDFYLEAGKQAPSLEKRRFN